MACDEALADRIRPLLRRRKGFAEKRMFGGIGFLLDGNMCVGVWKDSLVVRFDKSEHEQALAIEHVKPFDITGKAMRGWALIEPAGLESDDALRHWVSRSAEFAASLPAK